MSPQVSPFARTHRLTGGPAVRLRLARPSDLMAVIGLMDRRGVAADEFELARLLAHDPTRRVVMCALAPIGGSDVLVGFGGIERRPGAEVDTLVVDADHSETLGRLLGAALEARADAQARRVA